APRPRVPPRAGARAALLALERLVEPPEPGAHGFQRRAHGARRDHARDADLGDRLLAREQDLVQPLARADAGEDDLDVAARLEAGEADDALGEVDDLHRLAHVEHIDRTAGPPRAGPVAGPRDPTV